MGFKEFLIGNPDYNTSPPNALITAIMAHFRIDIDSAPDIPLTTKFLMNYGASAATAIPLFGHNQGNDIQAITICSGTEYGVKLEVNRMFNQPMLAYWRSKLLATFPDAPNFDATVYGGYFNYYPSGWHWLTGWTYRKSFLVHGSTAGTKETYNIRLTVNRSAGTDSGSTVYLGVKCNADFSDLRFTDQDGETKLSYYIESISGTVAIVWVKLAKIPSSGYTKAFNLYYGNAGASSESSITGMFLWHEIFDGDLSKWNSVPAGWVIDTARLKAVSDNQAYATISDYTNAQLEFQINTTSDASPRRGGLTNTAKNAYNHLYLDFPSDRLTFLKTGEVNSGFVAQAMGAGVTYRVKLGKVGTTWYAYFNDALMQTSAAWLDLTLGNIVMKSQSVNTTYFSKIFLHDFIYPEPHIDSWRAEETE